MSVFFRSNFQLIDFYIIDGNPPSWNTYLPFLFNLFLCLHGILFAVYHFFELEHLLQNGRHCYVPLTNEENIFIELLSTGFNYGKSLGEGSYGSVVLCQ